LAAVPTFAPCPTRRSSDLELRAPAVDLECHGGELRHGPAIEGIVRVERPEAAFGLVPSEEPLLLGRDRPGVFLDLGLALEDHRSDRKSTRLNSSHQIISYA